VPFAPRRYFGLHFRDGIAGGYKAKSGNTINILITEEAINKMRPSYEGKPIFTENHVKEVNETNIQNSVGYVVKSFHNTDDGHEWMEFLVTKPEGLTAIKNGWKLSNSFDISDSAGGGYYHGVEYCQTIKNGAYDHVAILQTPRYKESLILNPAEFKDYNKKKREEKEKFQNSIQNSTQKTNEVFMPFGLFSRTKLEESEKLLNACVRLENGSELSINELIAKHTDLLKVHNDLTLEKAKIEDELKAIKAAEALKVQNEASAKEEAEKIANAAAEKEKADAAEKAKIEELKNASKKVQNTDAPAKVYMSDLERGKKYF